MDVLERREPLPVTTPAEPIAPGTPAPDFAFIDSDGTERTLADLRGAPVIVAFYPSAWDPARSEQVALYNRIASRVPGAGATLLEITTDGPWHELTFADDRVRVPVVTPAGDTVAARYGARGGQALFVVDAQGLVCWRHVAPLGVHPRADDVRAALERLAPVEPASNGAPPRARPAAPTDAPDDGEHATPRGTTRREFVATTLAAVLAMALTPALTRAQSATRRLAPAVDAPDAMPIALRINGRTVPLTVDPRVTLLDALREYAGLMGTKKGCDHGQCGACTVHVNGRRINSCLTLAVMHDGEEITTIEGLAQGDALHPMQQAFIDHDGFQCGYCTSGQIMSAVALLKEPCGPNDDDVRECMSGNICRCGAYQNIVAAIQEVRHGVATRSDASGRE